MLGASYANDRMTVSGVRHSALTDSSLPCSPIILLPANDGSSLWIDHPFVQCLEVLCFKKHLYIFPGFKQIRHCGSGTKKLIVLSHVHQLSYYPPTTAATYGSIIHFHLCFNKYLCCVWKHCVSRSTCIYFQVSRKSDTGFLVQKN